MNITCPKIEKYSSVIKKPKSKLKKCLVKVITIKIIIGNNTLLIKILKALNSNEARRWSKYNLFFLILNKNKGSVNKNTKEINSNFDILDE
jgi:hypothetical protein